MIWIPRICFAMAALFAGICALAIWLNAGLGLEGRAMGRVVRLEASFSRSSGGGGTTLYCPIIAFTAPDGRQIELPPGFCSSPAAYDVGEAVAVRFDPARPEDAVFGGILARYLIALVFGAFALLLLTGGIIAWILIARNAAGAASTKAAAGSPFNNR